jgi:hypothetical protein
MRHIVPQVWPGASKQTHAFHDLSLFFQLYPTQSIHHVNSFEMEALHLTWNLHDALIFFPVDENLGFGFSKCPDVSSMVQVQVAQGNVYKV